jgi:hypothetical protein
MQVVVHYWLADNSTYFEYCIETNAGQPAHTTLSPLLWLLKFERRREPPGVCCPCETLHTGLTTNGSPHGILTPYFFFTFTEHHTTLLRWHSWLTVDRPYRSVTRHEGRAHSSCYLASATQHTPALPLWRKRIAVIRQKKSTNRRLVLLVLLLCRRGLLLPLLLCHRPPTRRGGGRPDGEAGGRPWWDSREGVEREADPSHAVADSVGAASRRAGTKGQRRGIEGRNSSRRRAKFPEWWWELSLSLDPSSSLLSSHPYIVRRRVFFLWSILDADFSDVAGRLRCNTHYWL